jgi:predicted dehydrogenase
MNGVAQVGFGYWGPNLARNLNAHAGDRWRYVVDVAEDRRKQAATLYPHVAVTGDYDQVLGDPDITAIVIATPAPTHNALAFRAIEAGKHVFVEKPLTECTAEAVDLARAADSAGLVLMVGHIFEYVPAVRMMRQLIDAGEIGDMLYIHSQRLNNSRIPSDTTTYWSLGPHDVSIANHLIGAEPLWASARGQTYLGTGEEDLTFITVGYAGDVVAHMHISWLEPLKTRRTTVIGTLRSIVYDDMDADAKLRVYDNAHRHVDPDAYGAWQYRLQEGAMRAPRLEMVEPLAVEVQEFLRCTLTGERPVTDGWNGVRVVAVLDAVRESLRSGGAQVPVRLPPGVPPVAGATAATAPVVVIAGGRP